MSEQDLQGPFVIRKRCLRMHHTSSRCELCAKSCPAQALSFLEGQVALNRHKCTDCGACIQACPTEALTMPPQTEAALIQTIESRVGQSSISFSCVQSQEEGDFSLRCLQHLSSSILVQAAARGIKTIELYCGECKSCPKKCDGFTASDLSERFNALWGRAAGARCRVHFKSNKVDLGRRMFFGRIFKDPVRPQQKADASGALPFNEDADPWKRVPARHERLLAFTDRFRSELEDIPLKKPFYRPKADEAKCTGCTLCVSSCPTGALSVRKEEETLIFSALVSKCIGCNLCKDVCYTDAIEAQPLTDLMDALRDVPEHVVSKPLNPQIFERDLESRTREMFSGIPVYRT